MAANSIEQFVADATGTSHLRIEEDFGGGFVRLQTSEAERRQAKQDIRCSEDIVLELLRNARDAHASRVYLAFGREGDKRTITTLDNGDGIPQALHDLVFEPRVTSKLDTSHIDEWGIHGRGMALFSIAQNATTARVCSSDSGLGCSMRIETNLKSLPEKTDQSSFPTFTLEEGSTNVAVRGPRNILRTTCEFAIASRAKCAVYAGSPTEIAACLYAYGTATLSAIDRAFCTDVQQLPVVKRLATAGDPESFSELAHDMGLELSERTARRIMNGEVQPVDPILDQIAIERVSSSGKAVGRKRRSKGKVGPVARFEKDDISSIREAVAGAFGPIAEKYYLASNVDVNVTCKKDRISISIPLVDRESTK